MRDPVVRLRRWLEGEGWWDTGADQKLRADARIEVQSLHHSPFRFSIFTHHIKVRAEFHFEQIAAFYQFMKPSFA